MEDEKERGVCEQASERVRRRRAISRREKAEGSRSFAGDGKRNRGGPRWIERVEIDAKDGANGGDGGGGGGSGGGGDGSGRYERREGRDFTYLHPHQRRSARGETS